MTNDQKIDEILKIVQTERELNNSRFVQVSSGVNNLQKEMKDLKNEMHDFKKEVKEDINRVFNTLSEDIQAFAGDLAKLTKRVDKIEEKIA